MKLGSMEKLHYWNKKAPSAVTKGEQVNESRQANGSRDRENVGVL